MALPIALVHRFTGHLEFVVNAQTQITALLAHTEIDIRDGAGELMNGSVQGPYPLDLWPQMSAAQKTQLQAIYNAIVTASTPNVTSVS